MTIVTCDTCGITDAEVNIVRYRPTENYIYRDYCKECLDKKKAKLREEGYKQEDGYDC